MSPNVHASIADFIDGSSFEVWVLSPKRILIVPGPKCSIPALMRFTNYIFEEFEEGEIAEYQRAKE